MCCPPLQLWPSIMTVLRNVTASPEAIAAVPTTPPPGVLEDTLPPGPVTPPPWNVSGPALFYADVNLNRPSLNLAYSTTPLFRAAPIPLGPFHMLVFKNASFTTVPINLLMARMTFDGLGSAPLRPSGKQVKSALPLWALGLAPGETDAAKRCAATGWVQLPQNQPSGLQAGAAMNCLCALLTHF